MSFFLSKAVDSSLNIRIQKLSINRLCPRFNKLELNFYKLLSFLVQSKSLFIHPHHCHGLNIFSPKLEETRNCACLGSKKMQTCWAQWWETFFLSSRAIKIFCEISIYKILQWRRQRVSFKFSARTKIQRRSFYFLLLDARSVMEST